MMAELESTTAIADGVVGVPGSAPNEAVGADVPAIGGIHPENKPGDSDPISAPSSAALLAPDSTGPPRTDDYWLALIAEKAAAEFLGVTVRFMQARRQHGGGPKFVRISSRCIRYRRIDLNTYANKHLRSSTSDQGDVVAV